MGLSCVFVRLLLLMLVSGPITYAQKRRNAQVFNVNNYGAVSDGRTENSEAFLRAWEEACKWEGKAVVMIPSGVYVLDSILFSGECNGPMIFFLKGVLKPPASTKNDEEWISFRYVHRLTVTGGGYLDGEGYKAWPYNNCNVNSNCRFLPISMNFGFITKGIVKNIRSVDSRGGHFSVFGCDNMILTNLGITAPGNSPNTDGIKIGSSTHVNISNTRIGTGDDCIALLTGSKYVDIRNVQCGPGHGISVGSMGKYGAPESVTGLTVKDCVLRGTTNGLRIKTVSSSTPGLASTFTYENVQMIDVANPIIIDQQYCPYPPCNGDKSSSNIQIRDIKYNNIWGTSSSNIAVSLQCSRSFPCDDILLKDINLSYGQNEASSSCSNVRVKHSGIQRPPSCF